MKLLENKVALVTGAGSGIGRAIATKFAEEGAKVVVSDVDEPGARETVARIETGRGVSLFVKADVSRAAECESVVERTVKRFGGLDVAVNNAGIGGPLMPVGEYPLDGWEKVIGINLNGVFYGMRYQIPAMRQGKRGGSIINMGSILSAVGFRGSAAYVSAKHGLHGLTQNAALEYGPEKIRVNTIAPGFIKTPLVDKSLTPEALKALEGMHALGRLGDPDEVAELALWLASDKSSFMTGAYLPIDGGYLAQ